jgi:zinc protease
MRNSILLAAILLSVFAINLLAQETPPAPGAPRSAIVPGVKQKKLANGLTVAVVERKGVPLVAVRLMINTGLTYQEIATAGVVKMSTDLLTKGTTTRDATKIANDIEFLGGNIFTSVGMDTSGVSMSVTSDKIGPGLEILSDVVLHPTFPEKELTLAKSQAIDELKYNLKQPSFLANYVASVYSLYLTPAGGTPESLKAMTRNDVLDFYKHSFSPDTATLIFIGDIDAEKAFSLAQSQFGKWKNPPPVKSAQPPMMITMSSDSMAANKRQEANLPFLKRMLVIDLPNSGQAAVSYFKQMPYSGHVIWDDKKRGSKISNNYFPGLVFNTVLGGGYSSRLNMEIRIKRGLSYGAGSAISWRAYDSRFSTRAQTKNESAPQVAELVLEEIKNLQNSDPPSAELASREAVLLGNFGRNLETNIGLLETVSDLYSNWLDTSELNSYVKNVQAVGSKQVREFASEHLNGGDIIIVGDYSIFKDDLAKRFPGMKIDVIKADELDLSKDNLRK